MQSTFIYLAILKINNMAKTVVKMIEHDEKSNKILYPEALYGRG
ncbi:MAG: hypothetical protein R6U32_04110 [Candidatus Woesearchaeota archaeon]